jgi:hypothetical protein
VKGARTGEREFAHARFVGVGFFVRVGVAHSRIRVIWYDLKR